MLDENTRSKRPDLEEIGEVQIMTSVQARHNIVNTRSNGNGGDVFTVANQLGESGKVIGIDIGENLIETARKMFLVLYERRVQRRLHRGENPCQGWYSRLCQSSSSLAKPHPVSVANVIPGYALCGGGAEVHYNVGNYLWSLEPTLTVHKITDPLVDQSFTGKAKDDVEMRDPSIITTYAIGIKMMV
jgi:hypothetical protein